MPELGHRLSPVRRVLRDSHVLGDAVAYLSQGDPVFVRTGSALRLLTARHAVGFPLSRRLIDVPTDPVRLVSADALSGDAQGADVAGGVVAVESEGRIVGWISPHADEVAVAAEDPAWRHLLQALVHDCANSMMLVQAALEDVEPSRESPSLLAATASVEHAAGLFRKLQGFYSGEELQPPELLSLAQLMDELAPLLHVACGSAVRLSVSVPEMLPAVRAYRSGLERVVINLVINARDAVERRGRIRISAEGMGGEAASHGWQDAGHVVLAVEDDGPGIAPELGDAIFDVGVTSKGGERGLGLAGVRSLLARMGAEVRVQRSSMGGARFEVHLRCVPT